MRFKMTPEELMRDLLNSESFDDLVAFRLQMSLDSCFETLERLNNLKCLSAYQFDDFVDTLRYARALTVVLEWFTVEDMVEVTVELNKFSMRLDNEF